MSRVVVQVKKIYENEKRLQAGEHTLDLLAHDFQKNYNMYIFPVHWQFGQLDQHPADGYDPSHCTSGLPAEDDAGLEMIRQLNRDGMTVRLSYSLVKKMVDRAAFNSQSYKLGTVYTKSSQNLS